MIPKKPALGLGPKVEAGFRISSLAAGPPDWDCVQIPKSDDQVRRSSQTMLEKKPDDDSGLEEGTPHYFGHRERLRDRFREAGADALSDYELLELLLFRVLPRRDVKPLAKSLLEKFGSFAEVIAAPEVRLNEVKGLGDACVTDLKIVQAAASRLLRGAVKKRPVLSSW